MAFIGTLLGFVFAIVVIAAYIKAVGMLVDNGEKHGCTLSRTWMWVIGLFTTPVVLGVIILTLPENALPLRAGSQRDGRFGSRYDSRWDDPASN